MDYIKRVKKVIHMEIPWTLVKVALEKELKLTEMHKQAKIIITEDVSIWIGSPGSSSFTLAWTEEQSD